MNKYIENKWITNPNNNILRIANPQGQGLGYRF